MEPPRGTTPIGAAKTFWSSAFARPRAALDHAAGAGHRRRLPHRIAVTRALAYGAGARQTLDVVRPLGVTAAPVVVFFYGGAWRSGYKELYRFAGKALARRGYVAVLPDYRIYPQARYPDFLDDAARAVRWVKDNATRLGGRADNLFLMGHSAGAHIAAMLAVDRRWLAKVAMVPGDVAGLIGIAGPYDFLPFRSDTLKAIFGGDRPETQPITHVTAGAPPALLLTGKRDSLVDAGNSIRFARRLSEAGNDAKVVIYPRLGHYLVIAALAPLLRTVIPVLDHADRFMTGVAMTSRPPR